MNGGSRQSEEKRGSDEDGDGRCLWQENNTGGYARAFLPRLETQPGHERERERERETRPDGCRQAWMQTTDKPHSKI